jgi:hypothetical protein
MATTPSSRKWCTAARSSPPATGLSGSFRPAAAMARRASGPRPSTPGPIAAAMGASASLGAPRPTCATSWLRARAASLPAPRPGSAPSMSPPSAASPGPTGRERRRTAPTSLRACAAPNTTASGAMRSRHGPALRRSTWRSWAYASARIRAPCSRRRPSRRPLSSGSGRKATSPSPRAPHTRT